MPTNSLIREKSPYLRQHAHNPVDWLAWGPEAFAKVRAEDKPIFLSIGYSTCHWCHVMAHESFEDEAVAAVLNRDFIPIKMDREERPDIDRIYMLFVQSTTGSGGWPMSVWLTPELKPFFGGTYFPPDNRYGRPGFRAVLERLAEVWKNERAKVEMAGTNVLSELASLGGTPADGLEPDLSLLEAAYRQFDRVFDKRLGGFGGAPKFPRPVVLNFLLRFGLREETPHAVAMVTLTLRAMAAGGMCDQLGGGFHRYSVDENWFVPHFEKMLYDQAQLAVAYLEAFRVAGDERLATVARGIFSYVARDLTSPDGAFYSAEDADSPDSENPGHSGEGAFYIWRQSEMESLLGPGARVFIENFGVKADGNVLHDPHGEFTGRNILFQAKGVLPEAAAVSTLLAARSSRPRPHLDNKVLTSWNGMFLSALAKGYRVLGDAQYLKAARLGSQFLLKTMYDPATGRLLRRYCEGEAAISGFLDDYAFFAQGLLDLFEVTGEAWYLSFAVDLAQRGFARFEDGESGGFFSTEAGTAAADVLVRLKDDYDGAEPSGNSIATGALLRLAQLTGDHSFRERCARSIRSFAPKLKVQPTIAPQMLAVIDGFLHDAEHVVVRCAEVDDAALQEVRSRAAKAALDAVVVAISDLACAELKDVAPFLAGLPRHGRMTVYECRNFTCALPVIIE